MRIKATDPRTFNDPFEVRPWFDQKRHDHFAKSHESFHKQVAGVEHSLTGSHSMVGFPTENAVDFGEELNKKFRDDIGRRFRVLCLSRNPKSVLMWGHYTRSHAGVVLGFDASVAGFPTGLKSAGFNVDYAQDRAKSESLSCSSLVAIPTFTKCKHTRRTTNTCWTALKLCGPACDCA